MDRLNVAIVDDESGIRETYARLLRREYKKRYNEGKIDISLYSDGREFLDAMSVEKPAFDVVLLDYHMPEMLGDEVLIRLRESDRSIPAIMITSQDSSETSRATFKAGGIELTEYMPKPPDFRLILYTIEMLAEKRQKMVFKSRLQEIEGNYKLLKEISENWKQPMNLVSMVLYRMVGEESREAREGMYDEAYRHIKKAASLLDIFKDYTLYDRKKENFDLCAVLSEEITGYNPRFLESNISVQSSCELEKFMMFGRKNLFAKGLMLLFRNCADALDRERSENKRIEINVEDAGIGCSLRIEDNSRVLDADELESIFDPKYNLKGEHRGGMELYLAYLCINASNGAIKCQNTKEGVSFVLYFP